MILVHLTLCMLGNFSCFCCPQLIFELFKMDFFKKFFSGTLPESNSLDPDQDSRSVGPDLGPNYLQTLSADDKSYRASKERVNTCQKQTVMSSN